MHTQELVLPETIEDGTVTVLEMTL